MTVELVIPLTVRHFHKPSGRLIATVVATEVANGRIAVGIARCNRLDRPSRKVGRDLAATRLQRGLGFDPNALPGMADFDREKNLFLFMSQSEFDKLIADNPFNKWACPFGVYDDELQALQPKPKKVAKKKATKKRK
jgi:hypothetical protein